MILSFTCILPLPTERCGEGEENAGMATAATDTITTYNNNAANTQGAEPYDLGGQRDLYLGRERGYDR